MSSWRLLSLAVAGLATVAACTDVPTGADPAAQAPPAAAPRVEAIGLDGRFAQLAQEVPGFGGAYVDDAGRMIVHMAGRDLATEAPRIREQLRDRLPIRRASRGGQGGARVSAAPAAAADLVLQDAAYDYGELVRFKERARAVWAIDGAVYIDIDETTNRIRIGLEHGADETAFRRTLEGRGVPAEAVTFTRTDPIAALKGETLQDRVQPLGGGLQLIFPHPTPGFVFLCTLGFNVDGPAAGRSDPHFITNSHCTLQQGGTEGTPYYQQPLALPTETYLVGHEVFDPEYFDCGDGFVCRFSDAALVQYVARRTPVKHDAIYRTESVNSGSLVIDDNGPGYFRIVDEAPFPELGDVLSKVGRTTGWTEGPVIGTCLDVGVAGTNIGLFCQDLVAASVAGGDSGSPVFMRSGDSGDVTLYGILWGGGTGLFAFSAMDNIRFELGDFDLY